MADPSQPDIPPPAPPEGEDMDWSLLDAEEQSKKIPAQFANRMFVKPEGNMLRVSLGEQVGDDVIYRSCFMVPAVTALEMGDLLTRMATTNVDFQLKAWREWVAANPENPTPNG